MQYLKPETKIRIYFDKPFMSATKYAFAVEVDGVLAVLHKTTCTSMVNREIMRIKPKMIQESYAFMDFVGYYEVTNKELALPFTDNFMGVDLRERIREHAAMKRRMLHLEKFQLN